MKVNREIRSAQVRVIDHEGNQLGILSLADALQRAELVGLDLVEVSSSSTPPVCKIANYGKLRYQQAKKQKENRKGQVIVKVKEIKLKPTTDEHDLQTKLRQAKEFINKGHKVRITCTFRGREMMHPEFGFKVIDRLCEELSTMATPEAPAKLLGRILSVVLAPGAKKKQEVKIQTS